MDRTALLYALGLGVASAAMGSKRKRARRFVVGGAVGFLGYHAAQRAGIPLPRLAG